MTPRRARSRATPRWEYVEPISVTLAPGGPTAPVEALASASPDWLVRLVSQTSSGSTWEIWLRTRSQATRVDSADERAVMRWFFSERERRVRARLLLVDGRAWQRRELGVQGVALRVLLLDRAAGADRQRGQGDAHERDPAAGAERDAHGRPQSCGAARREGEG